MKHLILLTDIYGNRYNLFVEDIQYFMERKVKVPILDSNGKPNSGVTYTLVKTSFFEIELSESAEELAKTIKDIIS